MSSKKSTKAIFGEYRSLRNTRVSELIKKVLEEQTDIPMDRAGQGDFRWIDDGFDEDEIQEERNAAPENLNQEFLMAFFDGHVKISDAVLEAYLTEKSAPSPNFPLFRRYFRQANPALRGLLRRGLDRFPTDKSLLHDLAFFHEHQGMLSEVIDRYTLACTLEEAIERFTDLAMDFYYNTIEDGFEALFELREKFHDNGPKRLAIDTLIREHRFPD